MGSTHSGTQYSDLTLADPFDTLTASRAGWLQYNHPLGQPQLPPLSTHIPSSKEGTGRGYNQTFLARPLPRFLSMLAKNQAPLLQKR